MTIQQLSMNVASGMTPKGVNGHHSKASLASVGSLTENTHHHHHPQSQPLNPKVSQHASATLDIWRELQLLRSGKQKLTLDGSQLGIAAVVAVARHGVRPEISTDEQVAKRMQMSVDALADYLSKQYIVYGVNTGYGGSADTRTNELTDLQIAFMQHLQTGIITESDKDPSSNSERHPAHVFPPEWVRAAMVARANQNLRGHSAVRLEVLQSLVKMIQHDIIPLVPLRGSISASGDLMPTSFIAGALYGNPDVYCQVGKGSEIQVVPSNVALQRYGLTPPPGPGPKEALGLVNGTAPSVAVASLVLHDSQQLAYLAQLLTAFTAESLGGNVEWVQPFVHQVRPHQGQIEAATNIRRCLRGSELVHGLDSRKRKGDGLWQDRYSTRTAPQWLSPYLEDLLLAQGQLEVELNSTSDNPLIEARQDEDGRLVGDVYSGGNFQATVVTSAMEKTRLALQMIGRMLFSQTSEMINPTTNNGLEANLNASDRESFTMKGIDTNMAAYASELASLAHPVSAHVLSAEMHNQGINSLALISARRTMEAADVVSHMAACQLLVSCQAVEIRVNHLLFWEKFDLVLRDGSGVDNHNNHDHDDGFGALAPLKLNAETAGRLADVLSPVLEKAWYRHNTNTWKDRVPAAVEAAMAPTAEFLADTDAECTLRQLAIFRRHLHKRMHDTASSVFFPHREAVTTELVASKLGDGSARLYTWVREKLRVPAQMGLTDDPLYAASRNGSVSEGGATRMEQHSAVRIDEEGGAEGAEKKLTTGSWLSKIYESVRGDMMDMVMGGLESGSQGPKRSEEFEELVKELKERY